MTALAQLTQSRHICLADSADLEAIVAIYNQNIEAKTATADLKPVAVHARQAWFDSHMTDPNRPIYVIKNDLGEMMAWGSFSNLYERPAYHISSEISIYVSRDFQRQGLARQLIDWMLVQAPKLGIQNVVALVFAHNEASLALFERLGFVQWGVMPQVCDMDGFTADVVMLGKAITPSQ